MIDEAMDQLEDIRSRSVIIDPGSVFCFPYYRPVIEHKDQKHIMDKHADTAQWRVYREIVGGV
jgi:hypothetical protein